MADAVTCRWSLVVAKRGVALTVGLRAATVCVYR